jgi:hypothetical protein
MIKNQKEATNTSERTFAVIMVLISVLIFLAILRTEGSSSG